MGLHESWGRAETPLNQTSGTPSWGRADHGAWKILLDAQDETRHQGRPLGRVEIPLTERDQTPWGNLVELRESWGRVNCEAWRHRPTYGTRRHHGTPMK